MAQGGWIYIIPNKPRGTLYIGVTSDIARRAFEHREGAIEGFTKEHGLKMLVFWSGTKKFSPQSNAKRR